MLLYLGQWHPEVAYYLPDVPVVLVGTKKDMRGTPELQRDRERVQTLTTEEPIAANSGQQSRTSVSTAQVRLIHSYPDCLTIYKLIN
jgi:GTPase SAR1 family protein